MVNDYEYNANGFLHYSAHPGDTIWDLAQKFDTTVDCIMLENRLTSTNIEPGQNLIIPVGKTACALDINNVEMPSMEAQMQRYSVVYGDSLWKIANRFGTTVEELKRLNGLRRDSLTIGQILRIV